MIIKRTINFYPNKGKMQGDGNAPLRCYIRWEGISVTINIGYNVNVNGWNADTQRCKRNTFHDKQNIPANEINKVINNAEELINDCFTHFESKESMPTKEELKDLIDVRTGKKKAKETDETLFSHIIDLYLRHGQKTEKWSNGTERHIRSLRNQMEHFGKDCHLADFDNPDMPERLLNFFLTLGDGHNNTTLRRKISLIKTVLRWAIKNCIIDKSHFLNYKVELKTPKKPVIFLTWEELMRVYTHDFSSSPHLNNVRDVFCFCCFTSLRYSDVANLKKENIRDNCIHLTTIKTADTLIIELNKYSKAILDKYEGFYFRKNRILPVISNQNMNEYLKIMAKACEIDSPITVTTYKGNRRIETTKPKYEFISSHTGRRTFISNAIMLGIPPEIVMKWSGHSDYKAMKPYIEIANEAKKQAMSIFDKL